MADSVSAVVQAHDAPSSQESFSLSVGVHDPGVPTWPTDTDIIFLPGSNKVMLTVQRPLMRVVIQDAIERTRANLMFANAFPDVFDTLEYIRDALATAAEGNERAVDIYRRLQGDHEYNTHMSRLVSSFILIMKVANLFPASCAHPPFSQGG